MRIAISIEADNGLDSIVNPHFGRCPFFVLVDVNNNEITKWEVVTNPYFPNHQPGQVPEFIHMQNADVMLTGGMGARAIELFNEYGIEPVTGAEGTVHQTLAAYLNGHLHGFGPCAHSEEHQH